MEPASAHDYDATRYVYDDDQPNNDFTFGTTPQDRTSTTTGYQYPYDGRRNRDENRDVASKIVPLVIGLLAGAMVFGLIFFLTRGSTEEAQTFTISFETNGGDQIEPLEVEESEQVFTPKDPTRAGYDFKGWFTKSDFSEAAVFPFEAQGNLILYAKWEEHENSADGVVSEPEENATVAEGDTADTSSDEEMAEHPENSFPRTWSGSFTGVSKRKGSSEKDVTLTLTSVSATGELSGYVSVGYQDPDPEEGRGSYYVDGLVNWATGEIELMATEWKDQGGLKLKRNYEGTLDEGHTTIVGTCEVEDGSHKSMWRMFAN